MSISTAARYKLARHRWTVRTSDVHGREVAASVSCDDDSSLAGFDHLLILIHGYNNNEKAAKKNYEDFAQNLEAAFRSHGFDIDAVVHFHWPGNPSVVPVKWLSPKIHYPYALKNAKVAAQRLHDLLSRLDASRSPASPLKVSLAGHSMGCRLIVEMLQKLPAGRALEYSAIGLMAAAIPVKLVSAGGTLEPSAALNEKLLKFYSPNDGVLRSFFPLGQWWSYKRKIEGAKIEQEYYGEAVGLHGNPTGFAHPSPRRYNRHGDYWSDKKPIYRLLNKLDPTYAIPRDKWEISGYALDTNEIEIHGLA
jgi:pimeloyl-ACP methyl ester carboxylesterase